MNRIKAVIVEDELALRTHLIRLIEEIAPEIFIAAECAAIEEANIMIRTHQPQLVFLDIVLPGGTGFDVLDQLPDHSCEVIFITAHDTHAIEAIQRAAVGYILKPVRKEELLRAVHNAKKRIEQGVTAIADLIQQVRTNPEKEKIAIPLEDGFQFVDMHDIVRCEGVKVYTWIYLNNATQLLSSYNLREFRKILPEHIFPQIHKSHIISIHYVKRYNNRESFVTMSDGTELSVSRRNKSVFLNYFKWPHRSRS